MSGMSDSTLPTVREFWEGQAETYDVDVDHGLRAAPAREAWRARLSDWLPAQPASLLDLGCGTGSLDRLALEAGHRVVGVDLAPPMVALAEQKCAEQVASGRARFLVGDAAAPPVGAETFEALLSRHVLWTLPDPQAVLARWVGLVRPGGRLVLIEGRWWSAGDLTPYAQGSADLPWQGGVRAEDLVAALDPLVERLEVVCLSDDDALWGRHVEDERYAVLARTAA
jgi:ubiquinone/menaquinone biosynthesis C-methylase UbiE